MTALDTLMEFDHVIEVRPDGSVIDAPRDIYAPELIMSTDEDGQILAADEADYRDQATRQGWDLMTGYTAQYGYNGPVMHPSEYIGGAMERDIMAQPGYYVALTVDILADEEPAGWAVAYRLLDPPTYGPPAYASFPLGG